MESPPNNYSINNFLSPHQIKADRREKEREIEHNLLMARMERKYAELQSDLGKSEALNQQFSLYAQELTAYVNQVLSQNSQQMNIAVQSVVLQFLQQQQHTDQKILQQGHQMVGLANGMNTVVHQAAGDRLSIRQEIHSMQQSNDARFLQYDQKFIQHEQAFVQIGEAMNVIRGSILDLGNDVRTLRIDMRENHQKVVELVKTAYNELAEFKISVGQSLHHFEMNQGQFMNQVNGQLGKFQNQFGKQVNDWKHHLNKRFNQIQQRLDQYGNDQESMQLKLNAAHILSRLKNQAFDSYKAAEQVTAKSTKANHQAEMNRMKTQHADQLSERDARLRRIEEQKERAEWLASPKFKNAKHIEEVNELKETIASERRYYKERMKDLKTEHAKELGYDHWAALCRKKGLDPYEERKNNPGTYFNWMQKHRNMIIG